MEQLKSMKSTLMTAAQSQMGNLESVNAKELGEVIDMIKDLEEAIYYCTITKAMEEKEKETPAPVVTEKYYTTPMYYGSEYNRDMDRSSGRRYYDSMSTTGGTRGYTTAYPYEIMRDYREGSSPTSRRYYMEHKEMNQSKEVKMQDLENYAHELTSDIMDMIKDASPEEKQLMQKKLSALATKIV